MDFAKYIGIKKKPMLEKDFLARFRKKIKAEYPQGFIYKIPDTGGTGGMRPFDMILIIGGCTFCIEAKRNANLKPTEYQSHNLKLAENNGAIPIVLFPENEKYWLQKIKEYVNGSSDSGCVGPAR